MNTLRTLLFGLLGIALIAGTMLFTASLFVVFAGVAALSLVARALMPTPKQAPAYARARKNNEMRVWNDGRGTIIDL